MSNELARIQGKATSTGEILLSVPDGMTMTIIGIRAANNDSAANHTVHIDINGFLITGLNTPIPNGSALEVMEASKIVAVAGDVITAYSDVDNVIDLHISFLVQS